MTNSNETFDKLAELQAQGFEPVRQLTGVAVDAFAFVNALVQGDSE